MECRRVVQIFLPLLILLGLHGFCHAQTPDNLYSVVIQVSDNTMATRNQHLPVAFEQVIKKVASSHQVLSNAEYITAREHPERFISHYFYTEHGDQYMLNLRFNEPMISSLLHKMGRSTLGKNRPHVLLWLVQEEAQKTIFIAHEQNDSTAKKIDSLAVNYGVPIILPLMDLTERLFINEQDIITGNVQPLQLAAERYSTDTILLGKIKHENEIWHCEWRLVVDQHQVAWNSVSNNLDAELELMINTLADNLITTRQAMQQNAAKVAQAVMVRVRGVTSVADYAKVVDHLKRLHAVQQVEIGSVNGDFATFVIQANGGKQQVLHDLRLSNSLYAESSTVAATESDNNLDLIYRTNS